MYDDQVRATAVAMVGSGMPAAAVARSMGLSRSVVKNWVRLTGMRLQRGVIGGPVGGGIAPTSSGAEGFDEDESGGDGGSGAFVDNFRRLTFRGRLLIQFYRDRGCSQAVIAAELGVARSRVCRELKSWRGPGDYRALAAHQAAVKRRARPKPCKLIEDTGLWNAVLELLVAGCSPEQVSNRLARLYPDDQDMHVSHETIYQALYLKTRGSLREQLELELAERAQHGPDGPDGQQAPPHPARARRRERRPRSGLPPRRGRPWVTPDCHISARPAEATDRAVPGHWEGDLIIGKGGQSALLSLVERRTRFTILARLPDTHDAPTVASLLRSMFADLPASLRRSLTWDQGSELAGHAAFTLATGCPVYLCDPHSPWQRGTNENTNGLVREYWPKGTDFRDVTDAQITHTAHLLNTRPRKTLDWQTPAEAMAQLLTVATTD